MIISRTNLKYIYIYIERERERERLIPIIGRFFPKIDII